MAYDGCEYVKAFNNMYIILNPKGINKYVIILSTVKISFVEYRRETVFSSRFLIFPNIFFLSREKIIANSFGTWLREEQKGEALHFSIT